MVLAVELVQLSDTISESNLKVLQGKSLKIQKGHYKVMNKKLSDMDIIQNFYMDTPSRYREFISHSLKIVVHIDFKPRPENKI